MSYKEYLKYVVDSLKEDLGYTNFHLPDSDILYFLNMYKLDCGVEDSFNQNIIEHLRKSGLFRTIPFIGERHECREYIESLEVLLGGM